MSKDVIEIDLSELKKDPNKYLDKVVKLKATLYYAGKKEIKRGTSINLPEKESVTQVVLRSGDEEIMAYGEENLELDKLNEQEVEVIGEITYSSGEYLIRIIEAKSAEGETKQ